MNQRNLYITQHDFKRLQELLEGGGAVHDRDRKDLTALTEELKRATIVAADQIPAKVVTMNTRLRLLDLDTQKPFEMTVVFPQDAHVDSGKVSVISPVGERRPSGNQTSRCFVSKAASTRAMAAPGSRSGSIGSTLAVRLMTRMIGPASMMPDQPTQQVRWRSRMLKAAASRMGSR